MLPRIDFAKTGLWLLVSWGTAFLLFWVAPHVDLTVSSWFWTPGQGFLLQSNPVWQEIRYTLWNLQIALCGMALVALIVTWLRRRPIFGLSSRAMGFVCMLFLLGPGLLVNGLFKSYGGRARPADITQFGGEHLFSLPWVFADQCSKNCSFPSGEVSSMVAMAITLWLVVALIRLPIWGRTIVRTMMVIAIVFIMVQRVTDGRHFVSDVIFGALMMATLAWCLYAVFLMPAGRWRQR